MDSKPVAAPPTFVPVYILIPQGPQSGSNNFCQPLFNGQPNLNYLPYMPSPFIPPYMGAAYNMGLSATVSSSNPSVQTNMPKMHLAENAANLSPSQNPETGPEASVEVVETDMVDLPSSTQTNDGYVYCFLNLLYQF